MIGPIHNWAKNFEFQATGISRPNSVAEIQERVRQSPLIKALGTRHSFNPVADTAGVLISTENLNQVISLDLERRTVSVQPGIRYRELGAYLHTHGFTLANFASLPHITVAGACATATHGSGVKNGNLATAVREIEWVTATGELVTMSRDRGDRDFPGSVVALGALGIVVRLVLDIEPTFQVAQQVFEGLPFGQLESSFNEITETGYSVSLFTTWTSDRVDQVWVKSNTAQLPSLERFGAKVADGARSPIPGGDVTNCTEQLGVFGSPKDRLPHFRMGFTPSSGEELQSEFFVARTNAFKALAQINEMREAIAPLLHTSEIRCIASDDLWLSPNYERDSVAIHFTWKQEWAKVRAILPEIEARLAPFDARPHWGKLFTMSATRIHESYPRFAEFRDLVQQFDPGGKFRNTFLDNILS